MKEVGKVTHYYGNAGVAIIELSDSLRVGDKIKFSGKPGEFEQTVESMEIEHEKVSEAKKKDVIGLKVDQKVSEGALVYRVE